MDLMKNFVIEQGEYDGYQRSWSIWLCSSYIWGRDTELLFYIGKDIPADDALLNHIKALAEHMHAVLVIPHPLSGGWNVDNQSERADDISFLNQLYKDITDWLLDGYSTLSAKRYLIGREDGTAIAARWLSYSPLNFTAAYLHHLNAFPENLNPLQLDVDNPLPLWLDACQADEANGYFPFWKMANQATCLTIDENFQQAALYVNPNNKAQRIYVTASAMILTESDFINLYDNFFNRIRRWRYNHNSGIVEWSPDLKQMGLTFHEQLIGGFHRSWYCHLPAAKACPEDGFSVLLAYHGMKTNGKYYLEQSEWYKIAREYGFILIAPNGYHNAWNADENPNLPDDCHFTEVLLEWVAGQAAINRSRIFTIGFSLGGAMVNRLLIHQPFLYAGGCAKSGQLYDTNVLRDSVRESGRISYSIQRTDLTVPMWQIMGETEEYDEYMGDEHISTAYWLKAAHAGALPTACRRDYDVYSTRIYEGLLSQYRFTYIKGIGHACYPNESRMIWEQFFSQLNRPKETVRQLSGRLDEKGIHLFWILPENAKAWKSILVTSLNGRQFKELIIEKSDTSVYIPISKNDDYEKYQIWVIPVLPQGLSRGVSELVLECC